jgi:replicative DNA helicase
MLLGDVLRESLQYAKSIYNGSIPRYQTGIQAIDDNVPLLAGSSCLLAARSGNGKTRLLTHMLVNMCQLGYKVAYLSNEDSQRNLGLRFASAWYKNFAPRDIFLNRVSELQMSNIEAMFEDLFGIKNVWMESITGWDFEAVMNRIDLLNKKGTQIIIIDFLQRMRSQQFTTSKQREMFDYMSNKLTDYFQKSNMFLLGIAQLNREAETQGRNPNANPPMLSNIKHCGTLEEDASAVIMLQRDQISDDHDGYKFTDDVLLYVRKNRYGETLPRFKLDSNYEYKKDIDIPKKTSTVKKISQGGLYND